MDLNEFILSISFNISAIKTNVYIKKIIISGHNVDGDLKKFEEKFVSYSPQWKVKIIYLPH